MTDQDQVLIGKKLLLKLPYIDRTLTIKLIAMIIASILVKDGDNTKPVHITARECRAMAGNARNDELAKAMDELKGIIIDSEPVFAVEDETYNGDDAFAITISDAAKGYFFNLDDYMSVMLGDLMNLKRPADIRLYVLISRARIFKGTKYTVSTEEFRAALGIAPNKYPEYRELNRNVIIPHLKAVNNALNTAYVIKPVRTGVGGKTTGLAITVDAAKSTANEQKRAAAKLAAQKYDPQLYRDKLEREELWAFDIVYDVLPGTFKISEIREMKKVAEDNYAAQAEISAAAWLGKVCETMRQRLSAGTYEYISKELAVQILMEGIIPLEQYSGRTDTDYPDPKEVAQRAVEDAYRFMKLAERNKATAATEATDSATVPGKATEETPAEEAEPEEVPEAEASEADKDEPEAPEKEIVEKKELTRADFDAMVKAHIDATAAENRRAEASKEAAHEEFMRRKSSI